MFFSQLISIMKHRYFVSFGEKTTKAKKRYCKNRKTLPDFFSMMRSIHKTKTLFQVDVCQRLNALS